MAEADWWNIVCNGGSDWWNTGCKAWADWWNIESVRLGLIGGTQGLYG